MSSSPLIGLHRKKVLQLVEKTRIPAIYPDQQWATHGGLMSYGASIVGQYRRAATYVDKILKGAKPGDLPVEQYSSYELSVNLRVAKTLVLTIPSTLLKEASDVFR